VVHPKNTLIYSTTRAFANKEAWELRRVGAT
jgi:hypothetical protein